MLCLKTKYIYFFNAFEIGPCFPLRTTSFDDVHFAGAVHVDHLLGREGGEHGDASPRLAHAHQGRVGEVGSWRMMGWNDYL